MTAATRNGGSKRTGDAKSGSERPAAPDPLADFASREEVADYIASMLKSMRQLAHQKQMPFLSYMIGMALEQANHEKAARD